MKMGKLCNVPSKSDVQFFLSEFSRHCNRHSRHCNCNSDFGQDFISRKNYVQRLRLWEKFQNNQLFFMVEFDQLIWLIKARFIYINIYIYIYQYKYIFIYI